MSKQNKRHQSIPSILSSLILLALLILGGLFVLVLLLYSLTIFWFIWQGYRELFALAIVFIGAACIVSYTTFRIIFKKYHVWSMRREEHQRINRLMEQQIPDTEISEENNLHQKEQNSL